MPFEWRWDFESLKILEKLERTPAVQVGIHSRNKPEFQPVLDIDLIPALCWRHSVNLSSLINPVCETMSGADPQPSVQDCFLPVNANFFLCAFSFYWAPTVCQHNSRHLWHALEFQRFLILNLLTTFVDIFIPFWRWAKWGLETLRFSSKVCNQREDWLSQLYLSWYQTGFRISLINQPSSGTEVRVRMSEGLGPWLLCLSACIPEQPSLWPSVEKCPGGEVMKLRGTRTDGEEQLDTNVKEKSPGHDWYPVRQERVA